MKRVVWIALSTIAVVVLAVWVLIGGENGLPLTSLLCGTVDYDSVEWLIFKNVRLPRVVGALSCGALLSMAGCMMQAVFRNPLVEPYTMGLSGGASLGFAIAIVAGFGLTGVKVMAFGGALLSVVIVLGLARMTRRTAGGLLLAGIVVSIALSSVNMLIISMSMNEFSRLLFVWTVGSLDGVGANGDLWVIMVVAIVGIVMSPWGGRVLDVLSLGEETANHIGVDARKMTIIVFVVAALFTALSVDCAGMVAFVGMIVPHVVRQMVGNVHRVLLPMSGVLGGGFLLGCDVLACRVIYPEEIPVGVFTGIIGGAFFIYMLVRKEARR